MCEMEGVQKEGAYVIRENTVGGEAHVCNTHYYKWKELEELIPETNGDTGSEDFND